MSGRRVLSVFGFYVINQDETGVKLTLGKSAGALSPGLGFMLPMFQKGIKTKGSIQTIDLPDQQIVLSGNIAVTISGNLNFRVVDPERALLGVSDYAFTVQRLALTTISDVLGTKTIDEIRDSKAQLAADIEVIVADKAAAWGLADIDIRLTDAKLDESLQRAMTRETEAHKEATAIQIKAEGDLRVARVFAQAAETLSQTPGAMMLRVLQTLSDISNEKSTVVVPIPVELLSMAPGAQTPTGTVATPADAPTPEPEPDVEAPGLGKLFIRDGQAVAGCPGCEAELDVSEIWGDPDYDQDPDAAGQQIKCPACGTVFSLPTAK